MKKIVLGLSGGVDSAVSARLLKDMGYEVHGLFLDFDLASSDDARLVAKQAGIHFHIKHGTEEFKEKVCDYFVDEYLRGRTPNPCVVCNPNIKFKYLIELADSIGAEKIATGHYARVGKNALGEDVIMRANSDKDQTYMMCLLPREYISRIVFPLSDYKIKKDVRQTASEYNIPVAEKPDSMDACFLEGNSHSLYIESQNKTPKLGNFIDEDGKILGKHNGIHFYTTGQRRGLNISAKTKLFVKSINPETFDITLSSYDPLHKIINISNVNYMTTQDGEFYADVKVRYSKETNRAKIIPLENNRARIEFDNDVSSVSSGQFAVFYDGDILLGGGNID